MPTPFPETMETEDAALRLARLAAAAWRVGLNNVTPLSGFAAVLDHGGPCVAAADGAGDLIMPAAARLLEAFRHRAEAWSGTAVELSALCGNGFAASEGCSVAWPLHADGRFGGVMAGFAPQPLDAVQRRAWDIVAAGAAATAAMFLELEAQSRQTNALRALDAISHALARPTDLPALYEVIHESVESALPCDAFYLCLYAPERQELRFEYECDQGTCYPPSAYPLGWGPTSHCIRTALPFVLNGANANIQQGGMAMGQPTPSESAIHMPMLIDGAPIGVLSAQSYRPGVYDEASVRLLGIIASKAAIAVHNGRLLARIQGQVEDLGRLTRALKVRDLSLGRVDDLVLTCNAEGVIVGYNEAVCRALGYDAQEMLGQPITHLRAARRGTMTAFRHAQNRRVGVTAKDGRIVPVLYSTQPLEENGSVAGWIAIARNLTDLERTEAAGREAMALERRRISRDLHDGLIQSLSTAKMQLQILQRNNVDAGILREMAELQETVTRGLAEARHYIVDLKHAHVAHEGLFETARRYAHELGRVTGLSIGVTADVESSPLSDLEEVQLFFILREALNNVRKHARARRVRVEFQQSPGEFVMRVEDDGRGFDADAPAPANPTGGHWGLQHIRERAVSLGGAAQITARPGAGATITVRIPLQDDETGETL